MLNSRQRAQLKSIGSTLDTILHIGKGGITDNVVMQAEGALKAHEIFKGKVLENSLVTPKEAAQEIADRCSAEVVQVIGSKFILYRENKEIAKEKRIALVK